MILYDSIYIIFWKKYNYRNRNQTSVHRAWEYRGRERTTKGPRRTFWSDGNSLYFDYSIGYATVGICQNSYYCTHKMLFSVYINYSLINVTKNLHKNLKSFHNHMGKKCRMINHNLKKKNNFS